MHTHWQRRSPKISPIYRCTAWALAPLWAWALVALALFVYLVFPECAWLLKNPLDGYSVTTSGRRFDADTQDSYWLKLDLYAGPPGHNWYQHHKASFYLVYRPGQRNLALDAPIGPVHKVVGYDESSQRVWYIDADTHEESSVSGVWAGSRGLPIKWQPGGRGYTLEARAGSFPTADLASDKPTILWTDMIGWFSLQALYVAVAFAVLTLARRHVLSTVRAIRQQTRHCPTCNYDLRATTTGVCPECGAAITPRAAT
ncbi:MAG: hypothetical protein IT430_03600 [Phycisphaerales bacterium]|nr:hypothetical protein [Phycisphaerales bacterium]